MTTATKTPRRVRTRPQRSHSDRWGNVSRFIPVEAVRLASVGAWSGPNYEWRGIGALEVAA